MNFDPLAKATGAITAKRGAGTPAGRRGQSPDDADLLAEELARCSDCGRTPLIGESVHLYESADLVCELCRVLRRESPVLSAQVTHRLGSTSRNDPAVVVRVSRV
jgi:hypothetical protein